VGAARTHQGRVLFPARRGRHSLDRCFAFSLHRMQLKNHHWVTRGNITSRPVAQDQPGDLRPARRQASYRVQIERDRMHCARHPEQLSPRDGGRAERSRRYCRGPSGLRPPRCRGPSGRHGRGSSSSSFSVLLLLNGFGMGRGQSKAERQGRGTCDQELRSFMLVCKSVGV
jgi:hypothetical protein